MPGDLQDPFAWGDVRHTLLGAVITDAARTSREGDQRGLALLRELLDEPFLAPALDDSLLARLLDRVRALAMWAEPPVAAALAGVTVPLAEQAGSRLTAEFRLEFARASLLAGRLPEAAEAAGEALHGLLTARLLDLLKALAAAGSGAPATAAPAGRLAAACDVLARAFYDQRRYAEALPVFLTGAGHARGAADRHLEWDLLTSAAACRYLLGDPLGALTLLTARAEPLARELDDPACLSKSLGDTGNARMALGQLAPARAAYTAALEAARAAGDHQAQSDWLGNLGSIALHEGDAAASAALHREALDQSRQAGNPRSAIVDLRHLSAACAQQEDWAQALTSLEEAMRLAADLDDPGELRATQERLRDLHAHLGHWRQAVALDVLLNQPPEPAAAAPALAALPPVRLPVPATIDLSEDDRAFIAQAEELVAVGQLGQARSLAGAYADAHPDNFIGHFELGLVLNEAGEYRASIDAYERALALHPRWPSIHHNALNSWRDIGDLETPRLRYQRAVADDPFDPVPRMALGRLLSMLGRYDEAARELRQATLLDPGSWMAQQELAEALSAAARARLAEDWDGAWAVFVEAFGEYERLTELDQDRRASALTLLGEQCFTMAYESGLANPSFGGGMLADREARILGRAVAAFLDALRMAPERRRPAAGLNRAMDLITQLGSAGSWLEFGLGLTEAGNRDMAIVAFEQAISLDDKLAEAHYQLGLLLRATSRDSSDQVGQLGQAARSLDKAARLEPGSQRYAGAARQLAADLAAWREGHAS